MIFTSSGAVPGTCAALDWLVYVPSAPNVAEVVLMPSDSLLMLVVEPTWYAAPPLHIQSPAVRDTLVTLAVTPLVSATAEPDATVAPMTSPTEPALALLFVVVPMMPTIWDGVMEPVALSVVNAPVFGVVLPTGVLLIVPPRIFGAASAAFSAELVNTCPYVNGPDACAAMLTHNVSHNSRFLNICVLRSLITMVFKDHIN